MNQLRRAKHNMSNTNFGKFYVVREHRKFTNLPTGRYDVGTFYVEEYSFKNPINLYKEFTHWSAEAIDEKVFTDEGEANMRAITSTIKKLTEVKKKARVK
jgi:hypothetical protein